MSGHELAILAGNRLSRLTEEPSSETLPRGVLYFRCGPTWSLTHWEVERDGYPRHMGQVVSHLYSSETTLSGSPPSVAPRELVCLSVAEDPTVGRNPSDGNLVVSRRDSGAGLDSGDGKALTWTDAV